MTYGGTLRDRAISRRMVRSRSDVDVVLHLERQSDGTRRLTQVAVPARDPAGLVTMLPAVEFEAGGARPGPGADRLAARLEG